METRPGTDSGAGHDPSVTSPAPEKASVVEDFIDMFYAPSKVFARRALSGFGIHLLIISVIAAAFAFANRNLIAQIMDIEFQRNAQKMMAANPQLTQEMLNQGRGIQQMIAQGAGYVGTPIFIFILAFFIWLGAKIASAKLSYGQAALIATFAWIPRLLGSLLMTVEGLLRDTATVTNLFSLSWSPGRFMDPDTTNSKLFGVMGSLDVFSIWFWVLVAIGISVIGKVPRGRGYAVAAVLFILGTLPVLFR